MPVESSFVFAGPIARDGPQHEAEEVSVRTVLNAIRGAVVFAVLGFAGPVLGQGVPGTNPVTNPDGTKTYWCGNNMQWTVQQAIDDASPGDIVVVRGGVYVGSPEIDKPNLTIRPFLDADGTWESVVFSIPSSGPRSQNGWAVRLGPDTADTYVGRPRRFRESSSGFVAATMIVPGEYMASSGTPSLELDEISGRCFTFQSRSITSTGLLSVDGKATVEGCDFTLTGGFGGGVMLVGSDNSTAFVDCEFEGLHAVGAPLDADTPDLMLPNHPITIHAAAGGTMAYTFSGCRILDNRGDSIIHQSGGTGTWIGTTIESNQSFAAGGAVSLHGCRPRFLECRFVENLAGDGTVFVDGLGIDPEDPIVFSRCVFEDNSTLTGDFGGVMHARDDRNAVGQSPKVMFDDCRMDGNNGSAGFDPGQIVSPWWPTYRQGIANRNTSAGSNDGAGDGPGSADLNGDGIVNGEDLGLLFGAWGTDGDL